jgi:hypothetical protein
LKGIALLQLLYIFSTAFVMSLVIVSLLVRSLKSIMRLPCDHHF